MTDLVFDIYPADDPLDGTKLVRLTSDDLLQGSGYRAERRGPGVGTIKLSAKHTAVTSGYLVEKNYVRVIDLDLGASGEVIGGMWLNEGEEVVLSEDEGGGKILSYSGQGPLYYLHNEVMGDTALSASAGPHDQELIDANGRWSWGVGGGETYGGILRRAIIEAILKSPSGISALTSSLINWDDDNDSASAAWPAILASGERFEINVGDNLLDVTAMMMFTGSIDLYMDPDTFQIDALIADTDGTDRTGTSFGTGVVRFLGGTNIASDLKKAIHESARVTHMLVIGSDGVTFANVVDPDWSAGDLVVRGAIRVDSTNDSDALEGAGLKAIADRKLQTDTATFPHVPGDDESTGKYTPGKTNGHYWLGDQVTLHTGTGTNDYNNQTMRVAAINWVMREAGDWDIQPELGATYMSVSRASFDARTGGGCNCGPTLRLCDPALGQSGSASVVRSWAPTSATTLTGMTVEGDANTALIAIMAQPSGADPTFTYDADTGDGSSPTYNFTKYKEKVNTGGSTSDLEFDVYYLLNPVASNGTAGGITEFGGGDHNAWCMLLVNITDPDDIFGVDDSFLGTTDGATTSTNDITAGLNDLVLSLIGYTTQQTGADAPVPGGDQTLLQANDGSTAQAGIDQFILGVSSQPGAGGTTTNSWTQSGGLGGALTQWDLVIKGSATNNSLAGSETCAARGDHSHHAISTSDPTVDADETNGFRVSDKWTNTTSGKTWICTDASEGAAVWTLISVTNHADLSGLATGDPHTQYVKDSEFGAKGRILVGTGSGTFDDLPAGTDDQVLTAASGETSGVKWADAAAGLTNPMTTAADLIVGGASGTPTRLAKGSDSQVLTIDPTTHLIVWANSASGFTNPMTTAGDIITGGSSGAASRLGIGTATQVLTVNAGATAPEWADAPSGGGGVTQAYIGNNNQGASFDSTGNKIFLTSVTLAAAKFLLSIDGYVKGNGGNIRGLAAAVYEDNSGSPGKVIASSYGDGSNVQDLFLDSTARWLSLPCSTYLPTGTYWLAIRISGSSGVMQVAYDASSGTDKYIASGGAWTSDGSLSTATGTTNRWSIRGNTFA